MLRLVNISISMSPKYIMNTLPYPPPPSIPPPVLSSTLPLPLIPLALHPLRHKFKDSNLPT